MLSKLKIFILLLYLILVKVTETNRKCSIEENSTVICCAFDSKNPLLACGLDNGKWCLFKDDSTCSPFSEWTTNLYSSSATTGKVMFMDWDVNIFLTLIISIKTLKYLLPNSSAVLELHLVLMMELWKCGTRMAKLSFHAKFIPRKLPKFFGTKKILLRLPICFLPGA